jgi:hypothetical protein
VLFKWWKETFLVGSRESGGVVQGCCYQLLRYAFTNGCKGS